MKITIAYLPEEEKDTNSCVAAIRQFKPGVMIRKSDRHPPYKHIYLTTRKPENHCNSKENN